MARTINPNRIAQVREILMLDEADWPDDMSREKFYQFCLLTGFRPGFFRQDDPPDLSGIHFSPSIAERLDSEWQEIMDEER